MEKAKGLFQWPRYQIYRNIPQIALQRKGCLKSPSGIQGNIGRQGMHLVVQVPKASQLIFIPGEQEYYDKTTACQSGGCSVFSREAPGSFDGPYETSLGVPLISRRK
jgi:hypothetical protein